MKGQFKKGGSNRASKLRTAIYERRVLADTTPGTLRSKTLTSALYKWHYDNGLFDSIKFLWAGEAGIRRDVTFPNKVTKAYSLELTPNDATQIASSFQPYISGHIAPNETFALKNVNGGAAYMTHPTISFAANQAWSVTCCVNWNCTNDTGSYLFGNSSVYPELRLRSASSNGFQFISSDVVVSAGGSPNGIIGKNSILTFVADGLGGLIIYVNGVQFISFTPLLNRTSATINAFMLGIATTRNFQGQFHTHQINNTALTPQQALSLYNTIRGFIPEIPSVVIGGQTWATSNLEQVANSAGTLITDGNAQATWATNAAAYWAHHTDAATGAIYGKLYNSQAKAVINAGAPSGYRVATKADWTTLIAAGGNALKIGGTTYWLNDLGTNSTGFSAIGGGSRAANGTFSTIKATAQFWCGDTNEVLVLNSADNTATFITAETGAGYSIRLIKI